MKILKSLIYAILFCSNCIAQNIWSTQAKQFYKIPEFKSVGSVATGTTNIDVPYTSSDSGNCLIIVLGVKTQTPQPSTPSGWNRLGSIIGYYAGNGSDQGPVRQVVYSRIADGTETGNVSFTIDNGNSVIGAMYAFNGDHRATWDISIIGGQHNIPNTTAYNARSYNQVSLFYNDLLFVPSIINTDGITFSGQNCSDFSLATVNAEIIESGSTVGNDIKQVASLFQYFGIGFNGLINYNMTGNTSTATAPIGISTFIRIRQQLKPVSTLSNFRFWNAVNFTAIGNPGDNEAIFDGHGIDYEGPDAANIRYTIEQFNGRATVKYEANLLTGLNRRTETFPLYWVPDYDTGTQILEEIRFETNSLQSMPLGEWICFQNHTGSAPGFSSNHPLFYFGFAAPGQTGWDNQTGPAQGGEFIAVNNCSDMRYIFPAFGFGPNKVLRIKYFVRFSLQGYSPVFKVWVNDVLLLETYDQSTVTATDGQLGSNSLQGGASKRGVYWHSVDDETERLANIAAGHTNLTFNIPGWKMIILQKGDPDYIPKDQLTNNNYYLLNAVSTADL